MSLVEGRVGKIHLKWEKIPRGKQGEGRVQVDSGEWVSVRWNKDHDGVWIETPSGVFGYDIRGERLENGRVDYWVNERGHFDNIQGVSFLREGEELLSEVAGKRKKNVKIKSQMPGKVIQILVKEGEEVSKGKPLMIIEAMKMENEILAPVDGKIKKLSVNSGEAVESGAELALMGE